MKISTHGLMPKYSINDIVLLCKRDATSSVKDVGGQRWRRTNMLTREWQPICCGKSYRSRFLSPGPICSQREGQLVREDPVNPGHCQRDVVTQVQL